ncbi:20309_t:CDS:2, partial [Dentiscutata erythropus]
LKEETSLVNPDYTPNIKIDNYQGWQQQTMLMYNQVKRTDKHLQKEEINKLIKSSIPENPKLQENNIPIDFCFNQFIGLGLTVNYLYQVEEDNFKSFLNKFEQYCIK